MILRLLCIWLVYYSLLSYWKLCIRYMSTRNRVTCLDSALRLQEVEASKICRQPEHERDKVVSSMHRLPLPLNREPFYSFLLEADSIPGNNLTRKNTSMKNPNDPIRNQTRKLVSSSSVTQPNTPPRAPLLLKYMNWWRSNNNLSCNA
jgi:hypothetical protein